MRKCLHNAECQMPTRARDFLSLTPSFPHSPIATLSMIGEESGTQLQQFPLRCSTRCIIINVHTNEADAVKYDEGHVPAVQLPGFAGLSKQESILFCPVDIWVWSSICPAPAKNLTLLRNFSWPIMFIIVFA